MNNIINLLASVIAVIFVFTPHEFAHAYVAYKNGDSTAKLQGRMTLNPLKHIDPIGFISCALIGFGWANPVPVDPLNFKKYRFGMFTTSIAGIITNYIVAFIVYAILLCVLLFWNASSTASAYILMFLITVLTKIFEYSLCSVVFNLLPFYPLDGFRIVESLTREINPVTKFLKTYGNAILIILIVESFLCDLLVYFDITWAQNFDILGYVLTFSVEIIGKPITAFWSLIFRL